MQQPPIGHVAIACSDIQGSTPLWGAVPEAMQQALELHDDILRSLMDHHHGYEFSSEGDALKVAFASAKDALNWCMDVQKALFQADWSNEILAQPVANSTAHFHGLRVRMGIHVGEPVCRTNPVTQRMDYFGPVVNLAARVSDAPHGGQVVLTQAALSQLDEELGDCTCLPLGAHHLKGVAHPTELTQVLPNALAGRSFPALRTLEARRTNLVARSSSFVGRKLELTMLKSRLQGVEPRLLTLLGPGGTGKTRLSQQAGLEMQDHFVGGVWFCDLTEARDVDGICRGVAHALGINLAGTNPVDQLGNALLGRGPTLLILDNFEQVVEHAPATIGAWLRRAPGTRFLVSSRERLGLEGESVQDLEPLPIPTSNENWANLIQNPGVLLFIERARQVRMDFQVDEVVVGSVAEIVRMLDGLPLAIELAAARVRTLSPDAILRRLQGEDGSVSLKVLRGRSRDRQARQATIMGAIQWSWDLIEPWEKAAMAQCAVFSGGFDIDAAEAVLNLDDWDDAPDIEVVLEDLVDQSLLRSSEPDYQMGEIRFEMLRTIQSFCRSKLEEPQQNETVARHAEHYSHLGDPERLRRLNGTRSLAIIPAMTLELDNLQAIVNRSATLADAAHVVGAGLTAMELYDRQGPQHKAIELGDSILARHDLNDAQRARVLYRYGRTLNNVGRVKKALEALERLLDYAENSGNVRLKVEAQTSLAVVHRRIGDGQRSEAVALQALDQAIDHNLRDLQGRIACGLGALYLRQGRYQEARPQLEQATQLLRATDNARLLGMALQNLGHLHRAQGSRADAKEQYLAALALQEQVGAQRNAASVLGSLANIAFEEEQFDIAKERYLSAIQILREVGDRRLEGIQHGNLADLLLHLGELDDARQHLSQCLLRAQEVGSKGIEGAFLGSLGELERRCGRHAVAMDALESGESLLREAGVPLELAKLLCRRAELHGDMKELSQADAILNEVESIAQRLELEADTRILQKVQQIRAKIRES